MSYTPEITEITIADPTGTAVAVIRWLDEVSLDVRAESLLTNSQDWPDISAAILAGLIRMEQSTRQAQATANEAAQ